MALLSALRTLRASSCVREERSSTWLPETSRLSSAAQVASGDRSTIWLLGAVSDRRAVLLFSGVSDAT